MCSLYSLSPLSSSVLFFFFFNDTATTEIYTLSLHDALPISVHLAGLALERSRCRQERGWQAGSHWLLGEINSTGDPPEVESAEDRYRQALNLADKLGMRPLMAHCHFGLGKLYRRTGQREQAQEHLATATTMYREMDMRFWLEKAEAEQKT